MIFLYKLCCYAFLKLICSNSLFSNYSKLPNTPSGLPSSPFSPAPKCLPRSLQPALFRLKEILMTAKFSVPSLLGCGGRLESAAALLANVHVVFYRFVEESSCQQVRGRLFRKSIKVVQLATMYRICYVVKFSVWNLPPVLFVF